MQKWSVVCSYISSLDHSLVVISGGSFREIFSEYSNPRDWRRETQWSKTEERGENNGHTRREEGEKKRVGLGRIAGQREGHVHQKLESFLLGAEEQTMGRHVSSHATEPCSFIVVGPRTVP